MAAEASVLFAFHVVRAAELELRLRLEILFYISGFELKASRSGPRCSRRWERGELLSDAI